MNKQINKQISIQLINEVRDYYTKKEVNKHYLAIREYNIIRKRAEKELTRICKLLEKEFYCEFDDYFDEMDCGDDIFENWTDLNVYNDKQEEDFCKKIEKILENTNIRYKIAEETYRNEDDEEVSYEEYEENK